MNTRLFYYGFVFLIFIFMSTPVQADVYQTEEKPIPPEKQLVAVPPADSAFNDWVRVPYVETAEPILPTEEEKKLGCILFSRPLVDPIYPETIPLPEERITKVDGFGAWDQFVSLNFAIYPLVPLKNINVRVGDLRCGNSNIPASEIQVRLVTYRDITYPTYNSKGSWRRLPEYLQPVTTCDAPAKEPQRYCLTVRVPKDLPEGSYTGKILVSHDDYSKAIVLPLSFQVLPFKPLRDPNKAYSAYYLLPYWLEIVRTQKKHDMAWAESVLERELKTMVDYGLTRFPNLAMNSDFVDGKLEFVMEFGEIDKYVELMRKNGMSGPMIILGGRLDKLYELTTKKKMKNHVIIDEMPPAVFFTELDRMLRNLEKKVKNKNYPEIFFGPLDEIADRELSIKFGCRVYEAFHKHGFKTYTTMEPEHSCYPKLDPYIDAFASQAFNPSYEEVQKRHKKYYFCYPNHNSCECKDPVVMCKGGRMTYGFGFWRSGFDLLVPWSWRQQSQLHFYRSGWHGGCNINHPETGDPIMTTAWENFREGANDLKYLYTLEDMIVKRENSTDPEVQKLVQQGKDLLQSIWDSIIVQSKYMDRDLFPSDAFDSLRYSMGLLICKLNRFAATNDRIAPSVIVDTNSGHRCSKSNQLRDLFYKEKAVSNIIVRPVATPKDPLLGWIKSETESSLAVVPGRDKDQKMLKVRFNVDLLKDGTGNPTGNYLAGWPAMVYDFKKRPISQTVCDFLRVKYKVESNRPKKEEAPDSPLDINICFGDEAKTRIVVPCPENPQEGRWIEIFIPLAIPVYKGVSYDPMSLHYIRAGISENRYRHGDKIEFTFSNIEIITMKRPIFGSIDLSPCIRAKLGRIRFSVKLFGPVEDKTQVKASLLDKEGKSIQSTLSAVFGNKEAVGQLNFDPATTEGKYSVRFEIINPQGNPIGNKTLETDILR